MHVSVSSQGNFTWVCLNGVSLYFSYDTLIGFSKDGREYISENVWSKTTSKHLSLINPDKSVRLPYAEFKEKADKLIKGIEKVKV